MPYQDDRHGALGAGGRRTTVRRDAKPAARTRPSTGNANEVMEMDLLCGQGRTGFSMTKCLGKRP